MFVTSNVVSSSTNCVAIRLKTGAVLISVTTTLKLCVADKLGEPSALTRTTTSFVLGPCASVGVQTTTPFVELINMPAGNCNSEYVRAFAGMSASIAAFVIVNVANSAIVCVATCGSTGAEFTSLTTIVNVFVALSGGVPSSIAFTITMFVLGPCASVGVHMATPFVAS